MGTIKGQDGNKPDEPAPSTGFGFAIDDGMIVCTFLAGLHQSAGAARGVRGAQTPGKSSDTQKRAKRHADEMDRRDKEVVKP
jgi:hypothetical protein